MDAFENVHNTYDLTKLIRSMKHAEERDKEERELKKRIESYKSRRLERKAAKVLSLMPMAVLLSLKEARYEFIQ